MKRILLSIIGMCLFQSCEKFLEYKDNDKVIPDQLEHFEELIYGELIRKNADNVCHYLDIMTDDISSEVPASSSDDNRKLYAPWYLWAKEPQIDEFGEEKNDKAWEFFYHKIVLCNTIENEILLIADDLSHKKERLLAEVQTIRAMCYFYLVNIYGAPMGKNLANQHLGVPINRETGIYNKLYERATLAEVYAEMEADLNKAMENFQKGEKKHTIFRPNLDVARLFLSRVYLFQGKFKETLSISEQFIAETGSSIETLESLNKIDHNKQFLYSKANKSLIFSWWERASTPFSSWGPRYIADSSLIKLYRDSDIRGQKYFEGSKPSKVNNYTSDCFGMCYRVEEVYFNRAEAFLGQEEIQSAMNEINLIRQNRLTGENIQLSANTIEEAWKLFKEEKRREFVAENIRWFDIRRWQEAVVHKYHDFNNPTIFTTYELKAGSMNYILPLPLDIQRRNDKIEQIERETIVAQ